MTNKLDLCYFVYIQKKRITTLIKQGFLKKIIGSVINNSLLLFIIIFNQMVIFFQFNIVKITW